MKGNKGAEEGKSQTKSVTVDNERRAIELVKAAVEPFMVATPNSQEFFYYFG